PKYSLEPVKERLAELAPGVELLENLRFDAGEEANDPSFVDRLCDGQDLYVNDAFGSSHPAHAPIVGPPARLPSGDVRQLDRTVATGWKGLDVGPGSAADYSDAIAEDRTLFWNGPMAVFEDRGFEAGTRTVAQAVAECRGFTVVGGGDSASALKQFRLDREVDHVSTEGGASLEYIEQGDLPGIEALRKASNARR